MPHPALQPGGGAVITGGASGIGLAAAKAFAGRGLHVLIADRTGTAEALEAIRQVGGSGQVLAAELDVGDPAALVRLQGRAAEAFGGVSVLMNNAGSGANPGKPWEDPEGWRRLLETNLWGVINGVQAFVPAMLASERPGLVINTGSKQGITLPPGNSAYNVSKAGVKAFTELLAYELDRASEGGISAHLLIPGFTFTGMTRLPPGMDGKPAAAWTPEQVVDFMLAGVERGEFYLLCPDGETPRELDEKRIAWSAGDLIKNRPPLSRWRPEYAEAFRQFVEGG